jgi:hypothetical protein
MIGMRRNKIDDSMSALGHQLPRRLTAAVAALPP